jgi:hypothetical protein
MIKEFQCPGCVSGSDTKCGTFELESEGKENDEFFFCSKHCPATYIGGIGKIALGLPKGFNREGFQQIRLYMQMPTDLWNHLNVPVWALEQDGYLFVKTFCPRTCRIFIDIIKGGKTNEINATADSDIGKSYLSDYKPIDVSKFYKEID